MSDEVIKLLLNNIQNLKSIGIALCVLLFINIISIIIKYITDIIWMRNKEIKVNRKTALLNKALAIQEDLFYKLETLTLFDSTNQQMFLASIQEIDKFIARNRLYLDGTIQRKANNALDYFKRVLMDYRKKDYETENKLLNEYSKAFNR